MNATCPRRVFVVMLLLAGLVSCDRSPEPVAPSVRHVVIVSIDTLRRDHLVPYGYARPTTPRLQRLAESGVVFDLAVAANTNTAPSHATVFTGLYPHRHGVQRNGDALAEEVATLAEVIGPGAARAAFVSGYPLQRKMSQLDRGFDHYDDDFGENWQRIGEQTVDRAIAWLEGRARPEQPVFLFVHLYDPHHPYEAPEPFATRFLPEGQEGFRFEGEAAYERFWQGDASREELREYVARYDAEIAYADHQVGRLFDALEASGLWDSALVIVLSDHGETLDERAAPFTHGGRVYGEQSRVPLLVRLPGDRFAGQRVAAPVHHIDVAPTVLDFLGVEASAGLDGMSLRPLLETPGSGVPDRPLFTTALPQAWRVPEVDADFAPDVLVAAIRSGRWKLIAYPGRDGRITHLFDLEADPGEKHEVSEQSPEVASRLVERIEEWSGGGAAPAPELDAEQAEALEALGYIE